MCSTRPSEGSGFVQPGRAGGSNCSLNGDYSKDRANHFPEVSTERRQGGSPRMK